MYPAYAEAIARKASEIAKKDEREARFQYALASSLYARSNVLNLVDFYIAHLNTLDHLFGKEKLGDLLENYLPEGIKRGIK